MVVTYDHELPTFEELTVEEVPISTPGLRAAAHHIGDYYLFCNNVKYMRVIPLIAFREVLSGRQWWIHDVQTRDERPA